MSSVTPPATGDEMDRLDLDHLRALTPAVEDMVRHWLTTAESIAADAAGEQLAGLLRDPNGLDFTVRFVDGVIRPEDHAVAAQTLRELAARPPAFVPWPMRKALQLGGGVAPLAPGVVVPIARRVLREMVSHLIIDATDARLGAAIAKIRTTGVRLNINLLGEAVLGRREADRRLEGTRTLLERDDVDYVSIKASATTAPHQPWSFAETVDEVIERLLPLYRFAAESPERKFINLDMEEYKDLGMTLEVFTRILDHPELLHLEGGIVLQAYLPDSLAAMQHLQEWAARRVAAGGAPIKVRLVKGANLPMEQVDASLHGWPLATWGTKQDSDTHYKRVLLWALRPDRIRNVKLGVAGHNLFDIAFAWLVAREWGVEDGIDFEMLLGMAPGQAEAVRRDVGDLLLYTPVVHPREFDVAIAYLIRRLEEGASRENFMSAVFELVDDEALFERERDRFLASLEGLAADAPPAHRVQDRRNPHQPAEPVTGFASTPDSDPSLPANQAWARGIRDRAPHSRLGIDTVEANRVTSAEELDERIRTALDAGASWAALSGDARAEILHRAGQVLEAHRADLMEVAAVEASKLLDQSDPEVSEAVDFAHFYAELARNLDRIDGAEAQPAKLIVVTPPWNFPIAIPTGSTLAALASGAPVIIKPAPASVRTGAVLVEALWEAGVPRDVLQLVDLSEEDLGAQLLGDDRVERVILTGAFETAELFRTFRPDLQLLAETSGKNALIVTPSADYDLAVKDLLASAFGHAGQKCSAASLLILVGQAGRSPRLRNQLLDGVRSLTVGRPWDATAQMGPLIAPADGKLLTGLTTLGDGENWVVEPRKLDAEGQIWSPGVRWGVRRGSEYHLTEYFGPILGIMHVESLEEAIDIANEVDYGLTSGIHSLEPDEIGLWLERIQAGNLYVNRGITGAIVQRQPFGGWKRSVVGPTTKAGGPNYLIPLVDWRPAQATEGISPTHPGVRTLLDTAASVAATTGGIDPAESASLARAAASDELAWQTEFGVSRDVQGLLAERDLLRYLPMPGGVVRLAEGGRVAALVRVLAAAVRAGAAPSVSTATALAPGLRAALAALDLTVTVENDAAFRASARSLPPTRIRLISADPDAAAAGVRALAEATEGRPDLAVIAQPVTEAGRVEMLPFLREQAVAITAHRFGTPNHLTADLI